MFGAGSSAGIDPEDFLVGGIEDPSDKDNLIRVQVPLTDLDFCHSAAGDVAAA